MLPLLYSRKYSLLNIKNNTVINIFLTGILFYLYNQCFFIGTDVGSSGAGGVFVTTTNPMITFQLFPQ